MERLAIIGTGVAGLGCAHFLQHRFDLTLFERNGYVGGHTNTVDARALDGSPVPIDTGFMVFNKVTYPHLTRLFGELDVEIMPTDMSFAVRDIASGTEWNGSGMNEIFGQRRNLVRPRFWKMLTQISRFNSEAAAALDDPTTEAMTLREFVDAKGYGEDFWDLYLVPMSASVWSTPPELMAQFPARTLIRFWHNHGFLGLHTQHPWWTVKGGSRNYVKKLTLPFAEKIHTGDPATSVRRNPDGKTVVTTAGGEQEFDRVIFATHADEALALLADPTPEEVRLLSPFKYQANLAVLHTDPKFMPTTKRCWASWNYHIGDGGKPTIHYWMNRLQKVSEDQDYFVSLNIDEGSVAEDDIVKMIDYTHPLFDLAASDAQKELPTLNCSGTTYFAGSYFRYGFHEDAFGSAVDLATEILGGDPW